MVVILKGGRTIKRVLTLSNKGGFFEILCEDMSKELVSPSEISTIL